MHSREKTCSRPYTSAVWTNGSGVIERRGCRSEMGILSCQKRETLHCETNWLGLLCNLHWVEILCQLLGIAASTASFCTEQRRMIEEWNGACWEQTFSLVWMGYAVVKSDALSVTLVRIPWIEIFKKVGWSYSNKRFGGESPISVLAQARSQKLSL